MISTLQKYLQDALLSLVGPSSSFRIGSHLGRDRYYLADGIYPRWSTFVKTISNPVPGGKNAWFAKIQEACRKDVERAFGVLQS